MKLGTKIHLKKNIIGNGHLIANKHGVKMKFVKKLQCRHLCYLCFLIQIFFLSNSTISLTNKKTCNWV